VDGDLKIDLAAPIVAVSLERKGLEDLTGGRGVVELGLDFHLSDLESHHRRISGGTG